MLALTSITAGNITINRDDREKEVWAKQFIIDREIGEYQRCVLHTKPPKRLKPRARGPATSS
jgi:hypothetical protein